MVEDGHQAAGECADQHADLEVIGLASGSAAIGLGERRSMSDYEPEGPVRLRQPPTISVEPVAPKQKYLPVWAVLLLIAGLIVLGWSVAQL